MSSVACKTCDATDAFATLETLEGAADITVEADAGGRIHYDHQGDTTIYWDSSTTTGYVCRSCGMQTEHLAELVKVRS